jgi:hypothetical protein
MKRELLFCFMNDEGYIEVVVTPFFGDTKQTERLARTVAELIMQTFGAAALREFRLLNPTGEGRPQ